MTESKEVITYDVQRLEELGWISIFTIPHKNLSKAKLAYKKEVKYNTKSIFRIVELCTKKRIIEISA